MPKIEKEKYGRGSCNVAQPNDWMDGDIFIIWLK
jgi:hypothetical protein